jgi:hypothetical protein
MNVTLNEFIKPENNFVDMETKEIVLEVLIHNLTQRGLTSEAKRIEVIKTQLKPCPNLSCQ